MAALPSSPRVPRPFFFVLVRSFRLEDDRIEPA